MSASPYIRNVVTVAAGIILAVVVLACANALLRHVRHESERRADALAYCERAIHSTPTTAAEQRARTRALTACAK